MVIDDDGIFLGSVVLFFQDEVFSSLFFYVCFSENTFMLLFSGSCHNFVLLSTGKYVNNNHITFLRINGFKNKIRNGKPIPNHN